MLLIQAPEANSEPSQAYKKGTWVSIASSYLKAYVMGDLYEDTKGLFV